MLNINAIIMLKLSMFFQNPKERAVLLEYSNCSSAVNVPSTVDRKNARNQLLNETLSPKKLPGSALLPSSVNSPPLYAVDQTEIDKFTTYDHYLATDVRSVAVPLDFVAV